MNITGLAEMIKELTDKLGREATEAVIEELDKVTNKQ